MTGVRRYAAVLGVALLTCLAACAADSSAPDVSPSGSPAAVGELVVADAARVTSLASPLRVRIAYVVAPTEQESLRMEGVVDWATSRAAVEEWVDPSLLGVTPSPGSDDGIRLVGRIYVDAERAVEVGIDADGTAEPPEVVLGTAASLAGLEDDPEPDADGSSVAPVEEGLLGLLSDQDFGAGRRVSVDGRDLVVYEGHARAEDVADVDVWLDADGRIAQMVRHTDGALSTGRITVVFSDFGTDDPISPPPEPSPTAGSPPAPQ
jgi:hypothetical protein